MQQISKTKTFKIFFFAFLLFVAGTINAQVGIGTPTPNTSAQLDVNSTSKGFLPPRMTQVQRDAISSPVAGLTIWCKDCGILGELQVYNGATWTNMTGAYAAMPLPATVTIGTQVWMTRNLDVVTYRNGDTIPEVKDPTEWANLTKGAWCYYNNDPALGAIYGKLYNRYAVVDPRGLAPEGWHVATSFDGGEEWGTLRNYLGFDVVAGKMRATILWPPNVEATNSSGFTALPGGERKKDGSFDGIGNFTKWWSPDEAGRLLSDVSVIYYYPVYLGVDGYSQPRLITEYIYDSGRVSYLYEGRNGYYVRCIKD